MTEGFALSGCEEAVVEAIRLMDAGRFSDARERLMDGLMGDTYCVSALLLMRSLRLDYPRVFGPTDITPEEMLQRALGAPADRRDRARAFSRYLEKAFAGSRTALFLCGSVAEKIACDPAAAFDLYTRAAEMGNPAAQFNLGCFYSMGQGVAMDKAAAARWFKLAADQGKANAQNNLGVLYLSGQGVPQDRAKAAELFKLAADQGHANAKTNYAIATRPVTPLKLPTENVVHGFCDAPLESPRECDEPWNQNEQQDEEEDMPLNGTKKPRRRRMSFSARFFHPKS